MNEQGTGKSNEAYQSVYGILLSQRLASMQVDNLKLHQGFHKATHSDLPIGNVGGCKSKLKVNAGDRVTIEEIEDKHEEAYRIKPKSQKHLLISDQYR